MTTARFDLDTLWDYDRPDASEKRFRDHLAALEALGDQDALAEALTQLARAERLQHLSTDPDFAERERARLERLRRMGGIDDGVDQDGRA